MQKEEITKKKEIPKSPILFVYFAAKQHAVLGFFAILCAGLAELSGIFLPYVLKHVIDAASQGRPDDVFLWIIVFPSVLAFMFLLYRLSGFIGMEWLTRTEVFIFRTMFDHLTKHSHSYFSNRFAGAISNKVHHASEGSFRLLDALLWGHLGAVFSIIATGIFFFLVNVQVGYVYIVLLAILIPLNVFFARARRPHVVFFSSRKTKLRGAAVDIVTNIGAVRQFAQRDTENERIKEVTEEMRLSDVRQWRMSEWSLVVNNILVAGSMGLILLFMYYSWSDGSVTTGDFVLVLSLLLRLSGTLVFIGNSMSQFIRLYGDVEDGLEEILVPYEIEDRKGAQKLVVTDATIDWQDATFNYGRENVFDHFNLTIKGGERIGLVGGSGAGKTTFVSLLLRQHELTDGKILIDGHNIAEVTQDSLREHIAVVPQEPMLFHRSIRENIAYGKPDATDEEIIEVAKKAEAHDFVSVLKEGYDTLVGERGIKLSGGQKQRIAIARAILKNAPILILDEATSALDSESEVAIQKALHELMEGKTVIAIAHRLSTLREMDRIIVLEAGKIVEDGTHDTLSKKRNGVYARLWKHQAGGFLVE